METLFSKIISGETTTAINGTTAETPITSNTPIRRRPKKSMKHFLISDLVKSRLIFCLSPIFKLDLPY